MSTRDVSNAHEQAVAKALGGRKTPNSGATPFVKGDVVLKNVLIECKTKMTRTESFSVLRGWLTTLEEERIGMGKQAAALAFSFDCGKTSYYVIDERLMRLLVGVINDDGE